MGLLVVLILLISLSLELFLEKDLDVFFELSLVLTIFDGISLLSSDLFLLDLSLLRPFEIVLQALEFEDLLTSVFNLVLGGGTLEVISQTGIIELVALPTLEQAESVTNTTWNTVLGSLLDDLLWISVFTVLKLSKD